MKDDKATQSKLVSIRSILPPMMIVSRVREETEEASIAWAVHDQDVSTVHCHVMIRFPSVRRWKWLRDFMNENDPRNRCVPADSWRRGVRYLLHLDNPEKPPVPRSALGTFNIDDDDLAQLMAGKTSLLLPALREALSMSPYDAFSFLVERRGFKPHECTSAINLLVALQKSKSYRSDFSVSFVEPETSEERFDRLDDEQFEIDEWEDSFARVCRPVGQISHFHTSSFRDAFTRHGEAVPAASDPTKGGIP